MIMMHHCTGVSLPEQASYSIGRNVSLRLRQFVVVYKLVILALT